MLLAISVGLSVALPALFLGSWDLWAQTYIRLPALALAGAWLSWRLILGTMPLPPKGPARWGLLLSLLILAAAAASPVRGLTFPETANALQALAIVLAVPLLSREQRAWIERAARAVAWVLFAVAFYQKFFQGESLPASALLNPNAYAGYLLLALGLAWRARDPFLAAASVWALFWTRSLGAWSALAAALLVTGRLRSPALFWTGATVAFVCGILAFEKALTPGFSNRLLWWHAAAHMIADRPWLGFGPGAFPFLLPSYQGQGLGQLGSLYAHQVWLELAVDWGIAGSLLFLGFALWAAARGRGAARFAVVAALAHSMLDYSLLIPANLWLFAYFLGTLLPQSRRPAAFRARSKLPLLALTAAATVLLMVWSWRPWQAERLDARAQEAARAGDLGGAAEDLSRARGLAPESPYPPLLLARLDEFRFDRSNDEKALEAAAHWQEEGARLNPYRPASWKDLARLRTALGDNPGAADAIAEGRRYIPDMK